MLERYDPNKSIPDYPWEKHERVWFLRYDGDPTKPVLASGLPHRLSKKFWVLWRGPNDHYVLDSGYCDDLEAERPKILALARKHGLI